MCIFDQKFGRKYLGQKYTKSAFLTEFSGQKRPKLLTTTIVSNCCSGNRRTEKDPEADLASLGLTVSRETIMLLPVAMSKIRQLSLRTGKSGGL